MKKTLLYGSWILLYILCAVIGFSVTAPTTTQRIAAWIFFVLFFLPPCLLLADAYQQKDHKTFLFLRWVSGLSLLLSMIVLVANILSALGSETLGNVLHVLLVLVSTPMICSGNMFLSLFLWACIFFSTLHKQK